MRLLQLTGLFFWLLLSVSACGQSTSQKPKPEREKWLAEMLKEPVKERVLVQPVIRNEQMAVAVAEALAFNVYGEEQIKQERPYHTELINGCYWVITGTLPKGYDGGVFEVVLKAEDGQVVRLLHSK